MLSIHARVEGATPTAWEDPAYVQIWGPRFSVYVVAEKDRALFTVSRLFDNPRDLHFARDLADRLHAYLRGRRLPYDDVAQALGLPNHNVLRYVAPTGTLLMRWRERALRSSGAFRHRTWSRCRRARQSRVVTSTSLVRPPRPASRNGQVSAIAGCAAIEVLAPELMATRAPVGDGWILSRR